METAKLLLHSIQTKVKVICTTKTEKQQLQNFLGQANQREAQFIQAFSNLSDKRQAWQDTSGPMQISLLRSEAVAQVLKLCMLHWYAATGKVVLC